MKYLIAAALAVAWLSRSAPLAAADGPTIDLNQDTLRGDVRSIGRENWNVTTVAPATFRAGSVSWELAAVA